jgi:anti-sigma regulatory factor (Ser/Thr protein kinase)
MEVTSACVAVSDASHVAEARRAATDVARRLGFAESDAGRVALAATETATNLVKHAGGGAILVGVGPGLEDDALTVELLALDSGPGMTDVDACLVDGYSTAGSPGTGLGAVRRISTEFDCYSQPGKGTAVLSRIAPNRAPRPKPRPLVAGGLSVALPGETACGDKWAMRWEPQAMTVVISDGLGHGPAAAEAAEAAINVVAAHRDRLPTELMTLMHDALRHTRGAAVAVARVELEAARVRYCGVGNISASILAGERGRHLVSQNGTLGRHAPRIQEFTYAWPADGLLVLHSDGIGTRWRLQDYLGLSARHPSLIAGVLYRDHRRGRDDASALVVQGRSMVP